MFDDSYVKFDFIFVGDENTRDGQCVECNQMLANRYLNPSELKIRLKTKHL